MRDVSRAIDLLLLVTSLLPIDVTGKVLCFTCFSLKESMICGERFSLPPTEAATCDASCEKIVRSDKWAVVVERRCGLQYVEDGSIVSRTDPGTITYFCNTDHCNGVAPVRLTVAPYMMAVFVSVVFAQLVSR